MRWLSLLLLATSILSLPSGLYGDSETSVVQQSEGYTMKSVVRNSFLSLSIQGRGRSVGIELDLITGKGEIINRRTGRTLPFSLDE